MAAILSWTQYIKCLLIDKEEITLLFPIWEVTSGQTGQVQNILKGIIPKMKSGIHVCISNVLRTDKFSYPRSKQTGSNEFIPFWNVWII